MKEFTKIVRLGTGSRGDIFCEIDWDGKRLAISGVEGPFAGGGCKGSCGQIVIDFRPREELKYYAPGWYLEKVEQFLGIWRRWHLNDMVAGSPAQEDYLREHPVQNTGNYYTKACEVLANAGLNPDTSHILNGKPYEYGSAWLSEEVPESVLRILSRLPDTDKKPAWV